MGWEGKALCCVGNISSHVRKGVATLDKGSPRFLPEQRKTGHSLNQIGGSLPHKKGGMRKWVWAKDAREKEREGNRGKHQIIRPGRDSFKN